MITVGMNYYVIPGKEKEFEDKFNAVIEVMENMEGHERSLLYAETKDSSSYLIISEWSQKEAFQNFIKSEDFKNVTNWGKEQILRDRPRHQVYERGQ